MAQVPDPKLKYQQLLAYGKKLPPMPAEDHTDDNKVRGCVSQVCAGSCNSCYFVTGQGFNSVGAIK